MDNNRTFKGTFNLGNICSMCGKEGHNKIAFENGIFHFCKMHAIEICMNQRVSRDNGVIHLIEGVNYQVGSKKVQKTDIVIDTPFGTIVYARGGSDRGMLFDNDHFFENVCSLCGAVDTLYPEFIGNKRAYKCSSCKQLAVGITQEKWEESMAEGEAEAKMDKACEEGVEIFHKINPALEAFTELDGKTVKEAMLQDKHTPCVFYERFFL